MSISPFRRRFALGAAVLFIACAAVATAAGPAAATVTATTDPTAVIATETGLVTEVPQAYLSEDAPAWIEYAEPSVSPLAAGAICTKPLCGTISNKGAVSFTVATDYVGNGAVAANARRMTLRPGDNAGAPYDWDAVWVPAGSCGTFYTGAGYYFRSTNSRVGASTGTWHKIDDLGAHAIVRSGSCA